MKKFIYLLIGLFTFTFYASENLHRVTSKVSSDDIYYPLDISEWKECYTSTYYSIFEKSDGLNGIVRSFRFIVDYDIIKNEQDLYLIKTPLNPVSYLEKIQEDYFQLFGKTDESKVEKLLTLTDERLKEYLDKSNEKIDSYRRMLLFKYQAKTVDALVESSAHLYRLRESEETRPNPFIAMEYEVELKRRKKLMTSL